MLRVILLEAFLFTDYDYPCWNKQRCVWNVRRPALHENANGQLSYPYTTNKYNTTSSDLAIKKKRERENERKKKRKRQKRSRRTESLMGSRKFNVIFICGGEKWRL